MPSIPGVPNFPATLDDAISLVEVNNNASSTLNAAIDADDLLIPVTDPNEFSSSGFVTLLDNLQAPTKIEIVIFTSKAGNNLVVPPGGRGAQNTVAQAFAPGQFVEQRPTARDHTVLVDVIVSIQNLLPIGAAKRMAYYPGAGRAIDDAQGFEYQPNASPNVLIQAQADAHRALRVMPFSNAYEIPPFQVRSINGEVNVFVDPLGTIDANFTIDATGADIPAGFAIYTSGGGSTEKAYFGLVSSGGSLFSNSNGLGFPGGDDLVAQPNAGALDASGAGGLYLIAEHSAGKIVFGTGGFSLNNERARFLASGHFVLKGLSTDPGAGDLTSGDQWAFYRKNDKAVIAVNIGGTINYLSIQLDGSDTSWSWSTSAP